MSFEALASGDWRVMRGRHNQEGRLFREDCRSVISPCTWGSSGDKEALELDSARALLGHWAKGAAKIIDSECWRQKGGFTRIESMTFRASGRVPSQ